MILDFILPNRCLQCNLIIGGKDLLCQDCMLQISFTHQQFGRDNELFDRCSPLFPLENAFALMEFQEEGLSRKLVHQLKYRSQEKVGKILADWTAERLQFSEEKPDILVTVPLHPKKLKKRGYNQLHLYSNTLSKHWNIPHHQKFLKRNSYQKAQARKDKLHRLETKYDFSVTENLHGKHILLIDDVFTTGNTINTIAWEILKNPSNKISILVMAIDV